MLWLDTEIANWSTPNPSLSLLQVRDSSGRIFVVDVLDRWMRQVLEESFIPHVMCNPAVGKYAHYARHDRQFLGGDRAANFRCILDARVLHAILTSGSRLTIPFPQRLWLAFGEMELQKLIQMGESKEVPVLRWLPAALPVGPLAQQSRDWGDDSPDTDLSRGDDD